MQIKSLLIYIFFASVFIAQNSDSTYHFYFRSAAYIQKSDSVSKFKQFYKQFENCSSCIITLEGYTDKLGSKEANDLLALKRVSFVASLLVGKTTNKLTQIVYGEEKAISESPDQAFRLVKLTVFSPNERSFSKNEEINQTQTDKNTKLKEEIVPIKNEREENRLDEFKTRDKAVQLKILFYPGSTDLIRTSMTDLELLFNYLRDNEQVKAKIVGHVCCSPEMKLSKQRAEIVYNYLIEKGIDKKRLSYIGVSNTQPLVQEVDEASQKMNRRVEVFFTE